MDAGRAQAVVLEREDVTAAVASLLANARRGTGSALFIVGEAGLGKTTSIVGAQQCAASDFDVRTARGVADEASLPLTLIAQALGPAIAWEDPDRRGNESTPTGRVNQFHAALRSLLGASRPVLLALDDAHWADSESLALLSFLCRRIGELAVAVVATLRPWPTAALDLAGGLRHDGIARVERLRPLSEEAAAALLTCGGRSAGTWAVRRAVRLCAGNPLLLTCTAARMRRGRGRVAGGNGSGSLTPLLRRFAGGPPAVLRYAQAASVLGMRFRPEVAAELSGLDDYDLRVVLDALHRGGLLRARDASWAEFTHPLFRQALLDDLPSLERSRLHRVAFRCLVTMGVGVAETAEHAMHGRMFGDPVAVAILERAGHTARRSGAVKHAIGYLETAVELAGETASPALLLALGELFVSAGKAGRAVSLYERVLSDRKLAGAARADLLRMLGRARCVDGAYAAGEACFLDAAEIMQHEDPRRAVDALLDHASMWLLPPPRVLASTLRARELAAGLDEDVRARTAMAWGYWALLGGDASGIEAADAAASIAERHADSDLSWYLNTLGSYHHLTRFIERFDASERAFRVMLAAAERAGIPLAVNSALISHVDLLNREGRLEEALELLRRVRSSPQPAPAMADSVLAMAHAGVLQLLGRAEESAAWWQRAYRTASRRGEWPVLLWLWCIRGRQWLHVGRVADAYDLYRQIEEVNGRHGLGEPCAVPWARDAMRAYIAMGRLDDATRVLAWLERRAARLPCRWPRIAAHAGRAALAEQAGDSGGAEAHFRAALALHAQVPLRLEQVRTLIDYGTFLRRTRRVTEARRLLAEAVAIAESLGAAPLLEEAGAELKVAGGRRRPHGPFVLTPQEARVVRLAAGGATNAEISHQLIVSVKTVESHLSHAFGKLGVRSRRELARAWKPDAPRSRQPEPQGPTLIPWPPTASLPATGGNGTG